MSHLLEPAAADSAPAIKYDSGKPDLSIVPVGLLEGVARTLTFGANKYGRDNYKGGMESHRLIAACLRHIFAWQNGEDIDKESGLGHLEHAAANLAILLETKRLGTLVDARPHEEDDTDGDTGDHRGLHALRTRGTGTGG